jgi:hypothetical protein
MRKQRLNRFRQAIADGQSRVIHDRMLDAPPKNATAQQKGIDGEPARGFHAG